MLDPSSTVYGGDRFENDVLPAQKAGLHGVLLRRGPWGYVNEDHPDASQADVRLGSLDDLLESLERLFDTRGR